MYEPETWNPKNLWSWTTNKKQILRPEHRWGVNPQTHEPWTKKTCSWTQVWNSVQTWAWRPRSLWTWRPQKYVLLVTTAIYSQHARQDTSMREHVLILVLKTLAKTAWLPKLLHRNMFCFVSALFGNWILSHFFVPSYISYITVFDLFDPFGSFVCFLT